MDMDTDGLPPRAAVQRMVATYFISHVVRTMAVLGLADHLADGPRTVAELAAATDTHPPTLARFLRAAAALGLCTTEENGYVQLTPRGELLRSDAPDSMRSFALVVAAPYVQRAWEGLPEAIRTGEAAFPQVYGRDFWEYLAAHPEESARFDGAMSGVAGGRADALLAARGLSDIETLVDVGGGRGRLLATVLAAHPKLRGVLFDRPEVVAGADEFLTATGVRDRCTLVGGDFFVDVPEGGDADVLAQILHDWPDEQAVAILRACHRAMAPGTRLWIIEQLVQPGDAFEGAKLNDLLMLVLFAAQERTADEFRSLLEAVGFGKITVHPTTPPWSVVEAARR